MKRVAFIGVSFNISNITRKYNNENVDKINILTDFQHQIFGINMNIKIVIVIIYLKLYAMQASRILKCLTNLFIVYLNSKTRK